MPIQGTHPPLPMFLQFSGNRSCIRYSISHGPIYAFLVEAYKPTNSQTSLANSMSRLEARCGVLDFTYLLLCSPRITLLYTWHVSASLLHRSSLATLRTNRSTPYSFRWQKQFLRYNLAYTRLPLRQPCSLLQEELRIVNLMTRVLQIPNYQIDAVMSIALPTCCVHCQDAPNYATFDRQESFTEH